MSSKRQEEIEVIVDKMISAFEKAETMDQSPPDIRSLLKFYDKHLRRITQDDPGEPRPQDGIEIGTGYLCGISLRNRRGCRDFCISFYLWLEWCINEKPNKSEFPQFST